MNRPLDHAALSSPRSAPDALATTAGERVETPEAALARFREQWPVERTRDMAAFINGTPAERDAAAMRIAARAMERTKAETPADDAVRSLVGRLTDEQFKTLGKGHEAWKRSGGAFGPGSREPSPSVSALRASIPTASGDTK